MGKKDYSKEIAKGRYVLDESMTYLDGWLKKGEYLCGDQVSFADLLGYHELVSHVAGAILGENDWVRYPRIKKWFDTMSRCPHSGHVNQMIVQVGAMRLAGKPFKMTRKTSLAKGTELTPGAPG